MTRLAVVLTLLLTRPGTAQVELKWKWGKNDTFYVKTVTKVQQTLIIEDPRDDTVKAPWSNRGTALVASLADRSPLNAASLLVPRRSDRDRVLHQDYDHTAVVRYRVIKQNDDGSAVITQQVVPNRGKVKGGAPEDVEKPDTTLDGIELTLHVDAQGKVTKVEGGDKLLGKLTGDDSGKRDVSLDSGKREALVEALSEESLRGSASGALRVMPDKSVEPGASWTVPASLHLGALGQVKLERTFTLKDVDKKSDGDVARLGFTTRVVDYQPGRPGKLDAFRITDGYLSRAEGNGEFTVGVGAGRVEKATCTMNLHGLLTLRNSHVSYRTRLEQKQTVTLTVSDKMPAR
jgi:hypothetical protein